MSSKSNLRALAGLVGVALSITAATTVPSLRANLVRILGLSKPGGSWRLATILLALANLKNWPWVWHYRLFRGLIYQLWIQPTPLPPNGLFGFLITRTHTPLWEMDYNFHKSNSTYFSDVDISRTQLVVAILRKGIKGVGTRENEDATSWSISTVIKPKEIPKDELTITSLAATSGIDTPSQGSNTPKTGRQMTEEEFMAKARKPGSLSIALGGAACFFHKEIAPYRQFEIWTRLLTWDRKWMYTISYFVEAGALKSHEFVLQPWKNSKNGRSMTDKEGETMEQKKKRLRGKVYATSIAKYVVKKGRLSIPPQMVLERSSMLPPKPPGTPSIFYVPSQSPTPPLTHGSESPGENGADNSLHAETITAGSVSSVLEESLFPSTSTEDGEWTWESMERERRRGLRFAEMFNGLDGLRDMFDAGEGKVLGVFGDLLGPF